MIFVTIHNLRHWQTYCSRTQSEFRFYYNSDEFTGLTTWTPVSEPGCTPLPMVLRCVEHCPAGWPHFLRVTDFNFDFAEVVKLAFVCLAITSLSFLFRTLTDSLTHSLSHSLSQSLTHSLIQTEWLDNWLAGWITDCDHDLLYPGGVSRWCGHDSWGRGY